MNIDWRRRSFPPISRDAAEKANDVNLRPTEERKDTQAGQISPRNFKRGQLNLSTHSERSVGQCSRDSIIITDMNLSKDDRLSHAYRHSQGLSRLELQHGSKHSRTSWDTHTRSCTPDPELLSLGSIGTREPEPRLLPNELIRRMREVTQTNIEEEQQVIKRRPSLTLGELTDVLCHINTAEACGLPIQWDLVGAVVQPTEHNLGVDEGLLENYTHSSGSDRSRLSMRTIWVPADFENSSFSSLSIEGHDFVDDANWESTESFALPFSDMKMCSTRGLTGSSSQ